MFCWLCRFLLYGNFDESFVYPVLFRDIKRLYGCHHNNVDYDYTLNYFYSKRFLILVHHNDVPPPNDNACEHIKYTCLFDLKCLLAPSSVFSNREFQKPSGFAMCINEVN